MEKWKIALIGLLSVGLLGLGIRQQIDDQTKLGRPVPTTAGATPVASPYLGQTLPTWNFKVWHGQPVPFGALKGKTTLVEIFRTGCSHCQDAAPFMSAVQKRYGPRGLQIVAIQSPGDFKDAQNPENKWPDVQAWLKERGVSYSVAQDTGSAHFQGTVKDKILGGDEGKILYPTLLFVDETGKVDFGQTGHDTGKAITLAVEAEKRFPTSDDAAKNAEDLVKWLKKHLPELPLDEGMKQAFTDDIAQRLQGKQ